MTKDKLCGCIINKDKKFTVQCEVHEQMITKLLKNLAELEYIRAYSKTQHPLLSSQACPLCSWDWEIDEKSGFGKGNNRKECGYHYALHQLYKIKIVEEE